MEISQIIGYILAVFVGITLGMLGSGGSILSVPILVYVMGIEPTLATAYSLFVIGSASLVGGLQKARQNQVDYKKVLLFGIPTVITVFFTRRVVITRIPEIIINYDHFTITKSVLIMLVFAVVMIVASIKMIKPSTIIKYTGNEKLNYYKIGIQGVFIGLISGFVGAGGGFLIIPTLLFLAKTPMKIAVGTSLFIVASQSLIGFIGDLQSAQIIDWKLVLLFTVCSIVGIFIGNSITKKVEGNKLKIAFGWFVLAMGIYIIIKEFLLT